MQIKRQTFSHEITVDSLTQLNTAMTLLQNAMNISIYKTKDVRQRPYYYVEGKSTYEYPQAFVRMQMAVDDATHCFKVCFVYLSMIVYLYLRMPLYPHLFTMVSVEQMRTPQVHKASTNADVKMSNISILAKALEHFLQDGALLMSVLALSLTMLQKR